MLNTIMPYVIGFVMIIITVIGDSLIKTSSLASSFSGWRLLLLGSLLYGITGIGWFFVMRHMKLSTLGVFYGVGCILFLSFISVLFFKEKISLIETVGIINGIIALILLFRFG